MDPNDRYKVLEIKALKRPGHEEALKMLQKIAKQVQPIMRKHKWTVNLLSEFEYSLFSLSRSQSSSSSVYFSQFADLILV